MTMCAETHMQLPSPKWEKVADDLNRSGFSVFDCIFLEDNEQSLYNSCEEFIISCRDLTPDRHSKFPGRNRRYGRFLINQQSGTIIAIRPMWDVDRNEYVFNYQQKPPFNPEHKGQIRKFSSLTQPQTDNPFLQSLILKCFSAISWRWSELIKVGVHVVQYSPKKGTVVESSPPNIHCDGEPFTWAFLLERKDVCGGENIITNLNSLGKHPDEILSEDIHTRFTLDTRMQGWVVDDLRVCHYVSPVTLAEGAVCGYRTVLLIDFTPTNSDFELTYST